MPVDGSQASMEAVALACSLGKRNKGIVYVVYVIEVARSLPLDAELDVESQRGEEILARAETVALDEDFRVEGELLQARDAGHAVVDEAIERGVEAVIMGIEVAEETAGFEWPQRGKPKPLALEMDLGRVAQYVLQNAPCEVWLIRRSIGER
ncbi:MAG TPA: universal stress protein [Dehalococcoidia bacterium]|nr:universal stress protein [Dehalococcoidia bacterium]